MTRETFAHIQAGTRLWNGALVTVQMADAYNSLQDRMRGFSDAGLPVPDQLRNGSHNLIAGGCKEGRAEMAIINIILEACGIIALVAYLYALMGRQ